MLVNVANTYYICGLCRIWRGGVNWTIAVNVFRLQIFCRQQSSVVENLIHTAEADTTET